MNDKCEQNDSRNSWEEMLGSGTLLQMILENSEDGINICRSIDGRRKLVACNDRYVEISGRTREQLMASNDMKEFEVSAEQPPDSSSWKQTELSFRGISSWDRPDGRENYYEWTAVRLKRGNELLVLGIDRDVTERIKAQKELDRTQDLWRAFTENTIDSVSLNQVDEEGSARLLWCNDRYVEMTGRSRAQLLAAQNISAFGTDISLPENSLQRLAKGETLHGVKSWNRPDGAENYNEWTAVPVTLGGKLHVIGITRDITERLRAERRVRENESRLRSIVDNSHDGINIAEFDPKTHIRKLIMCNDRYVEMSGRTRGELMAAENLNDFADLIENQGDVDFTKTIMRGEPYQGISTWRRPDGRENYYEWTAVGIEVGEKVHIVGSDRDITGRLRAEQALRESESRYRAIVESQIDAVARWLPDYTLTYVNDAYCWLYGRKREDLLGEKWTSLLSPDVVETVRKAYQPLLHDPTVPFMAWASPAPSLATGRHMHWTSFAIRDADGKITELQSVGRDITDLQNSKEALGEQVRRNRLMLDTCIDGFFLANCDGFIVDTNPAFSEMVGYSRDELIGMNLTHLEAKEIPQETARHREQILRDGYDRFETRHRRKDGVIIDIEISVTRVEFGDEQFFFTFSRDITEHKEAEEIVRNVHRRLAEVREEERRRLAADLHDSISQQLIAMQLTLRHAVTIGGEAAGSAFAKETNSLSDRCGEMVREIRQICYGLYPPTLESLGLVSALRQYAGDFSDSSMVIVRVGEVMELMRLSHDVEIALFRIAQEAVHNSVAHGRARQVEVHLAHHDGKIVMAIVDNGVGFDPDGVANKNGFGLNTMRDRALATGGEFSITSRPGRTRVEVHIPFNAADEH